MSRWAQLSGVLIVLISAVVQILFDPRITRRFIASSLLAFLIYAVYVGVGLAVALTLLPQGPAAAAGTTLSIIGWIGLGGLGLVRMAPRLREVPTLLAKFGVADIICLVAMMAGLFMAANA